LHLFCYVIWDFREISRRASSTER